MVFENFDFFTCCGGSEKVKKWSKMTQIAKHFLDQRLLLNKTSNHDIWCTGLNLTSPESFLKFWKLLFIPSSVGIKSQKIVQNYTLLLIIDIYPTKRPVIMISDTYWHKRIKSCLKWDIPCHQRYMRNKIIISNHDIGYSDLNLNFLDRKFYHTTSYWSKKV